MKHTMVTPEMAEKILENCAYDGQRPLKERRVLEYADMMRDGVFRKSTVITICQLPTGKRCLVNGQHTLSAILELGRAYPLVIEEIEAENMAEIDALYMTFDPRGSSRSKKEVEDADRRLDHFPLKGQYLSAIPYMGAGWGTKRGIPMHEKRKHDIALTWNAEIQASYEAIKNGRNSKWLKRGPVMAGMLQTYRLNPEKAPEFWGAVAHGTGLEDGDPALCLLTWLQTYKLAGNEVNHAKAIALAWNSYVHNKPLKKLRLDVEGRTAQLSRGELESEAMAV